MVEQENRMSGRARGTVAFLAVTVILFLFDAALITVTMLGCCDVVEPGMVWACIAVLWMAAVPLTVAYACALIPRHASY